MDKRAILQDLFGATAIDVQSDAAVVDGTRYPIVDDVVILSSPDTRTPYVQQRLHDARDANRSAAFALDIQATFGREWEAYAQILPEHSLEHRRYFDLVDLDALGDARVCDLGCGSGRWASFIAGRCREIVLVDFSDAIFVARKNLANADNALFFMGDLTDLPFRDDAFDLLYCLGVLHHLPTNCLDEVRRLSRLARRLLIFLYYALDNRPVHYRVLLAGVTVARKVLSRIEDDAVRAAIARGGARFIYEPLVRLGEAMETFGLGHQVPLYDAYHGQSRARIEQDVYDRFFTRIEQRVTRLEILDLLDTFAGVVVSEKIPYWHFLCTRPR
ncbi:MAG: hypothetical protein A2138_17615 [Deltaproteobacteria bacterium RBG_16_71_12]|nr:MAG: hypothetical protein A2138_17615 [Deltaproteobacteria bacterium RBG_16_71_12]